jgi:tetratricopeptide (TPR) repeat protein
MSAVTHTNILYAIALLMISHAQKLGIDVAKDIRETVLGWNITTRTRTESDETKDELLGIRLNAPKSAREQFFFSVQWTREGLREFTFPIVIWLTPNIATSLAQQAPDFWSWRGGVFEFFQTISTSLGDLSVTLKSEDRIETTQPASIRVDPSEMQKQIDELLAQDPDSPLLASLYLSLGDAYRDNIQYNNSEIAYRKALDLSERALDPNHPTGETNLAICLNNLAGLYESQGKYAEVEPLYLRAIQICEQTLGVEHPNTVTVRQNYETMCMDMN